MPNISTLIEDMRSTLSKPGWLTKELADEIGSETALRLYGQFQERTQAPTLRLSGMGTKCPKALWASIHAPGEAEPLPPQARFKFAYGHQIEALVIALAKASGHEVTGEQSELELDGIKGHRDCVIDGCVVDVKSASTRAFQKFKTGSIQWDDPFGYLEQLDGYVVASHDDPLVSCKDRGYLLAVDKQLGWFTLYEHTARPAHIRKRIVDYRRIVGAVHPPQCECGTVEEGKSGNRKLDLRASYSAYKHFCFPRLRTFLYAGKDGEKKPIYLSHVERTPDVTEVDRHGKYVYN